MKVYQTSEVRNIALIGGAKSGKTTLAEAMLFEGGVIKRRGTIEDKSTVSDYRQIELERQNSVSATVMYTEYNGKKVNIIDTPGFDDFVGEVIAALNVADTAVMVINAQNGVEVGTEISWRNTVKYNTPLIFAINHLEHEKSNFDETIRQLKQQFGGSVTVTQYPVNSGIGFNTIIDLLSMKMYKYPDGGGKPEILDIPDDEKEKATTMQKALIEDLAAADESLMEIYFENDTLTEEEISRGLKLGLINRGMFPVLCVGAKPNMGVGRLLEFINNNAPAPDEMPPVKTNDGKELNCNVSDPVAAFVFKTSVESHLGEISYFKVYAGEITEGMDMINSSTDTKERISQLFAFWGKNREKVDKVVAGDIGATIKLKNTKTNTTLSSVKNSDSIIEPIVFPEPKFRMAVKAVNSTDDEKLGTILGEMHKMDPTLMVEYSRELKQILLHGQGELHLNIAKWYLEVGENVPIEYITPKIPYRETITKNAKASYRHKKQSGGAGQFGEVYMMIEPYVEGMEWTKEFPVRKSEEIDLDWGGKLSLHLTNGFIKI